MISVSGGKSLIHQLGNSRCEFPAEVSTMYPLRVKGPRKKAPSVVPSNPRRIVIFCFNGPKGRLIKYGFIMSNKTGYKLGQIINLAMPSNVRLWPLTSCVMRILLGA